jgi:hypothetical protein
MDDWIGDIADNAAEELDYENEHIAIEIPLGELAELVCDELRAAIEGRLCDDVRLAQNSGTSIVRDNALHLQFKLLRHEEEPTIEREIPIGGCLHCGTTATAQLPHLQLMHQELGVRDVEIARRHFRKG